MKEYYIFIAPACQNTTLKKRNQNKFDILNKNDFNFRFLEFWKTIDLII